MRVSYGAVVTTKYVGQSGPAQLPSLAITFFLWARPMLFNVNKNEFLFKWPRAGTLFEVPKAAAGSLPTAGHLAKV